MSTLSNDDVRRVRRCYKQGQIIKIQTVVCNRGNARIITTDAHIDGVYNRGMQVSFPLNHRYGKKDLAQALDIMGGRPHPAGKGIHLCDQRGPGRICQACQVCQVIARWFAK